jgi:hypothetical protein
MVRGASDSKHGLRVLEKGVLREIFGAKSEEVICDCKNYTTRSFMICTTRQIVFT